MSITQNIIDNKVEKRDLNDRIREISTSMWNTDYFDNITNVDNNHLINIIFGVLSIILVLYFYLK